MAVARHDVLVGRDVRIGRRVEAPLELTHDDPEDEMAPRRLREGAAARRQPREVVARRMHAIDGERQRPRRQVLGERDDRAAAPGRQRHPRRDVRVRGAHQRAVAEMDHRPDDGPPGPAGEDLAEQLAVVVVDPEDRLVERLLREPDACGNRPGEGSANGLGAIDHHGATWTVTLVTKTGIPRMDRSRLLARAQGRGVNPFVYWVARAVLQPFFLVYFRLKRTGMEHIPKDGALIIASNHRSFMDPWAIGMMLRRPVYYVAKAELFHRRTVAWLLSSLGAFPVDRGHGDRDAMDAARRILERGDVVVIFPEGTRTRPGALGTPKRGVGRLALETGAPVVPVALIGTEAVRKGWRIRPHKVSIRAGRPLRFPHVDEPSPSLARGVTERIWPCIELQWEWLGGTPALRRAAVIGAGSWGTGLAVAFARAGLDVELGCRTEQQAERVARTRVNDHYLP